MDVMTLVEEQEKNELTKSSEELGKYEKMRRRQARTRKAAREHYDELQEEKRLEAEISDPWRG